MAAEISRNSDPSPLSIFTTSSSLLTGEPAMVSSSERANLSHIFGNGFIVLIDSIEMVTKAEDMGLRFLCKGSVKLIPRSFGVDSRRYRGCDYGIYRCHESILEQFILKKPILLRRVGCLKAVSCYCLSRG
ncbi:hypothetical protein P3L10_034207 [Capsicum annuum]